MTALALAVALAGCGSAADADRADATAPSVTASDESGRPGSSAEPSGTQAPEEPEAPSPSQAPSQAPSDVTSSATAPPDASEAETADSDGGDAEAATGAVVTATNFQFDTAAIEASDGDTLTFTVAQGSHSFTSSGAGFDTGVFADDTVTVTVDAEPGTYSYQCSLHSQMIGEITVTG